MKIESGDNFITLNVTLEEDNSLPSHGDALISLSIHSNGYSGHNEVWIGSEELQEFCTSLLKLEKERKGDATLSSISPGELYLKLYSVDSVGHLAISGKTAYEIISSNTQILHSVEFGFEFEPSQLVKLINEPWVKQNAA